MTALLAPSPSLAQNAAASPSVAIDSALHALFTAVDARWNAHDAAGMAALHTPDADVSVRGLPRLHGRTAIESMFARMFAASTSPLRHRSIVDELSPATSEVAVVDGRIIVERMNGDSTEVMTQLPFTAVAVRSAAGWQVRIMRAPPDYTGAAPAQAGHAH